jgi:hypothetical protein
MVNLRQQRFDDVAVPMERVRKVGGFKRFIREESAPRWGAWLVGATCAGCVPQLVRAKHLQNRESWPGAEKYSTVLSLRQEANRQGGLQWAEVNFGGTAMC